MPSATWFVTYGILMRLTEGVGWAMTATTSYALLPSLFPSRVATLNVSSCMSWGFLVVAPSYTLQGILFFGSGLGFTLGPPIGSLLVVVRWGRYGRVDSCPIYTFISMQIHLPATFSYFCHPTQLNHQCTSVMGACYVSLPSIPLSNLASKSSNMPELFVVCLGSWAEVGLGILVIYPSSLLTHYHR